jgi:hypothetical protein
MLLARRNARFPVGYERHALPVFIEGVRNRIASGGFSWSWPLEFTPTECRHEGKFQELE